MIAKISNTNIEPLMNYLTAKKYSLIDANGVIPGGKLKVLISEFENRQQLNRRAKKKTQHIILSWKRDDNITGGKIDQILNDFMNQFAERESMWVAIRHPDTDSHIHLHIALNRIRKDGSLVSDSFSAKEAIDICRALEEKYQLQKLESNKYINENREIEYLKMIIAKALPKSKTIDQFKKILEDSNYKILLGRGITFVNQSNGSKIKGSAISRSFSLKGIQDIIEQNNLNKAPIEKDNSNLFSIGNLIQELLHQNHNSFIASTFQEDLEANKKKKIRKKRKH